MAIDFGALLSADQKRDILTQRLQQFAAEAYQHSINKELATKTGNEAGVTQADEALTILGAAIELHQDELAKLPTAE